MKKQYIVIGAGRFGTSVAVQLNALGEEVMVIDRMMDNVQALTEKVTHMVQADATDENALRALGVRNFDVAVVAIGSNVQASILITLLLKEMGLPMVVAKAQNEYHAKVLYKIGADRVILPERDMGGRVATHLISTDFFDQIELAPTCSVVEIVPLETWIGQPLTALPLRAHYGVSLMAIRRGSNLIITIDPETVLQPLDVLVVIGRNEDLLKLGNR